jgi:hypothetical protein
MEETTIVLTPPYTEEEKTEFNQFWLDKNKWVCEHPDGTQEMVEPPEGWVKPEFPGPSEDPVEQRKAEIQARLNAIDRESIRPLRAIADNTATEYDRQKLASLEEEAAALRTELANL